MTNKDLIKAAIEKLGFTLGGYNAKIDRIALKELKGILDNLDQEYTDVDVKIRGKLHVVEISTVDNEKDLSILTQSEYIDRYGNDRWEEE